MTMMADDRTMTTYKRADGEPIFGEYIFMIDDEWASDGDPVVVTEQVWVLKAQRDYVAGFNTSLRCVNCGEDVRPLTVDEVLNDEWPHELCGKCIADPLVDKEGL